MSFRTMTLADTIDVVSGMRPEDRACFRAVMGDVDDECIAVSRWQTNGPAWTLVQEGRPVLVGGASFANDWLAAMWMVAKPGMSGQSWRKLLRHTRTVLANLLDPANPQHRHRVESHVLATWPEAVALTERLGFRYEGRRIAAGRGGEDILLYAITRS